MENDLFDPFLGDKHFEDELIALINEGVLSVVLNHIYDKDSIKPRIADIRRGIRIFMARANEGSKLKMKKDYSNLKSNEEKTVWLFLSMGRCFYD